MICISVDVGLGQGSDVALDLSIRQLDTQSGRSNYNTVCPNLCKKFN